MNTQETEFEVQENTSMIAGKNLVASASHRSNVRGCTWMAVGVRKIH